MRLTAKSDYALRACLELAARSTGTFVKADALADAQGIPTNFLLGILGELKRATLVESKRGLDGGYRLALPSNEIRVADVLRAVDGPLASLAGEKVEQVDYAGTAFYLRHVWVALRTAMRSVLEVTMLSDIVSGDLPENVIELLRNDGAWVTRPSGLDVVAAQWDETPGEPQLR